MSDALAEVIAYHQATKHHFHAYARGPGRLDWATQPNPFRRYDGAPLIRLDCVPLGSAPSEAAFLQREVLPEPITHRHVSQLFYDSLALSAWKQFGNSSWALRINPSSGNLHPTEGYLLCGPIAGLCTTPMVSHYAPDEHALEKRLEFSLETWQQLTHDLPEAVLLVGFTSIHWREAWKYGERAYRYCQHDTGHAMAAVSLAAAALGWQATLLDDLGTDALAALLGVSDSQGAEAEEAHCLLAIHPKGTAVRAWSLASAVLNLFASLPRLGKPNRLSRSHIDWPVIPRVAAAARKLPTHRVYSAFRTGERPAVDAISAPLRRIIHQRRSAVAMDGQTSIRREAFYQLLASVVAAPKQLPFDMLPWAPLIHLALFVHRVEDLDRGLYFLVRNGERSAALRAAMKPEFGWEKPEACPGMLEFYRLQAGDMRTLSERISCHQSIAADGCFSLGMISEFERPLREYGAWFYPRLFWESGVVGQVLYLAAEALGLRGTGIGCFFDDPMHSVLGLTTLHCQSLYHFTIGGPVEDPRLRTLPPYSAAW
ncbi:MAG: SagB/ThcOx family dehydrogenase [Acidimicrobiia bacterium]|nr:SagB/ThcOx family dehydrogenase [Acidimicrobiia bacterium]